MARFSNIKLLFEKKIMGVNFKKKYKTFFFQKVGKSQNKVAVAEEISCKNDIVFEQNWLMK